MNYLYVMLGGALGAVLRYGVSRWCAGVAVLAMPLGTFVVNMLGCLLLGLFTACGEHCPQIPRGALLMLTVGMCGAFTTFSTFSSETVRLVDEGRLMSALLYVAVSVVAGFLLFCTGRMALDMILTNK